jgi:1-aminocyclopropane-1-carboxylate deaminase
LQSNPSIQSIPYLSNNNVTVEVLRLDQIHSIVSGNKWYKLRYYIQAAIEHNAKTIVSFGGPYSNHLVALAYAAKENGLKSIGYVRANEGEPITPTLQEATTYGMELIFLGRTLFQEKKKELLTQNVNGLSEIYSVDEGGYGKIGAKGASTIVSDWDPFNKSNDSITETNDQAKNPIHEYDYIICAVGTGTMIAGVINASKINQSIIGIPVLKNEGTIKNEILNLLEQGNTNFELLHTFHQGGYAKTTPVQIEFMNRLWDNTEIPTDIVYTGKVFYAVEQLINENYFKPNSKLLIIHSGGLQGNRSLAKGVLRF